MTRVLMCRCGSQSAMYPINDETGCFVAYGCLACEERILARHRADMAFVTAEQARRPPPASPPSPAAPPGQPRGLLSAPLDRRPGGSKKNVQRRGFFP